MRWDKQFLTAATLFVVTSSASPSFSQSGSSASFLAGGEFPIIVALGALGRDEQLEVLYAAVPKATSASAEIGDTAFFEIKVTNLGPSANIAPCFQSFQLYPPLVRGFNSLTIRPLPFPDGVMVNGADPVPFEHTCFENWTRLALVITVQPHIVQAPPEEDGEAAQPGHRVRPLLTSVINREGHTTSQSSGGHGNVGVLLRGIDKDVIF